MLTVTTTGTLTTVTFNDLDGVTLIHPGSYDYMQNFTIEELVNSKSLANALDAGYVIANYNGYIISTGDSLYNLILKTDSKLFRDSNILRVKKNPGINEFYSVKDALNSISDNSQENKYVIEVGPGIFIEDTIVLKEYISIKGLSRDKTILKASNPNQNLVELTSNCEIKDLTLTGVSGANYAAIKIVDCDVRYPYINNVSISDCIKPLYIGNNTSNCGVYIESLEIFGSINSTKLVVIEALNNYQCEVYLNNSNIEDALGSSLSTAIEVSGPGAILNLNASSIKSSNNINNIGICVFNGASVISDSGVHVQGFNINFNAANAGSAPSIKSTLITLLNGISYDLLIDHPGTYGYLTAKLNMNKVSVNATAPIKLQFSDTSFSSNGIYISGDILQSDEFNKKLNLSKLTESTTALGLVEGGDISIVSGLTIQVSGGNGFLLEPTDNFIKEVNWTSSQLTLAPNSTIYIYVTPNSTITQASSLPSFDTVIPLGRLVTNATNVLFIESTKLDVTHLGNKIEYYLRYALGPIFVGGSIVTESTSVSRKLDVTDGVYFYGTSQFNITGSNEISWIPVYRNGSGGFIYGNSESIVGNYYDNNTGNLDTLPSGKYATHFLYNANNLWFLVYSQNTYNTLIEATESDFPITPQFFTEAVVPIASIVIKGDTNSIFQIMDLRPKIGGSIPGISGASSHSDLTGLLHDDHPQYLLVNGTRSLTGNLNMGSNNIVNVGTINGVNFSSHASRHLPNGVDPLTTAPGIGLTANSTNSEGILNSLSRSDHSHSLFTDVPVTIIPDQSNSIGTSSGLARSDHIHNIPTGNVSTIGTSNMQGTAPSFARSDHIHAHGNQTDGFLHALATPSTHGFLSSSDKAKLNILTATYTLYADQFLSTNNSNWVVNDNAASISDPSNNSLIVCSFDDNDEEGVGFLLPIPSNAFNLSISIIGRARSGSGNVVMKLYSRTIPNNAAMPSWSAGFELTTLSSVGTNYKYFTPQTIALTALGISPSTTVQFELTRHGTNTNDTLNSDFYLLELAMRFT